MLKNLHGMNARAILVAMSRLPAVCIVVLNWNGLSDTRECLQSLQKTRYGNFHVVVVDNGSEADEASVIEREFPGFAYVIRNQRNLGFAAGANFGIHHGLSTGADYVLLLNNDVVTDPGFLSELVTAAEERIDVAAVCPKAFFYGERNVIYSTGGTVNVWTATARQVGRGQQDRGQFDRIEERGYADGLCMLMPAAAIGRVGLLDEDYFAYWEETDWCYRAGEAGLRCYYVPGARVWHKAARSRRRDNTYRYLYRRNAFLFVRKRGKLVHFVTALLVHLLVYAPRYFLTHPADLGRVPAEARALFAKAGRRARQGPLL